MHHSAARVDPSPETDREALAERAAPGAGAETGRPAPVPSVDSTRSRSSLRTDVSTTTNRPPAARSRAQDDAVGQDSLEDLILGPATQADDDRIDGATNTNARRGTARPANERPWFGVPERHERSGAAVHGAGTGGRQRHLKRLGALPERGRTDEAVTPERAHVDARHEQFRGKVIAQPLFDRIPPCLPLVEYRSCSDEARASGA